MALQTSGAISLNDIHIEAGGSSGTNASINDADIRGLISKASETTMSFSEWYGASNILTMSAQSLNTATGSASGTSFSTTMPTFAAGDIAIVAITITNANSYSPPNFAINLPSGWSSVYASQATSIDGYYGKDQISYIRCFRIYYKILTSSDTSVTHSVTRFSGFNVNWYSVATHVYRPSATISSVTLNDVSTAASQTINCSSASATTIALLGSGGKSAITHSWSAGPTYQNGDLFVIGEANTAARLSTYVQNTSTPSDVTASSSTQTYARYASAYLEIT